MNESKMEQNEYMGFIYVDFSYMHEILGISQLVVIEFMDQDSVCCRLQSWATFNVPRVFVYPELIESLKLYVENLGIQQIEDIQCL